MITKQEIRIGNIINQGKIDCIHPQCVEVITEIKSRKFIDFYEAEPILLRREYFQNFGFTKYGDKNYLIDIVEMGLQKLVITFSDEIIVSIADYYSKDEKVMILGHVKIKYVHHLQNLYFTLTGQELNLNQ